MNFLSNLRISHKIIFLMVGLIAGFIAIGVTYYVQVMIDNANRRAEHQLAAYQAQLGQANISQVRLHEAAVRFLLFKDNRYFQEYGEAHVVLEEKIQALRGGADALGASVKAQHLVEAVDNYHRLFERTAQNLMTLGMSSAEGVRGALNAAAADVEQQLQGLDFPVGLAAFLQMRRHEKNYMNNMMPEDRDAFHEASQGFNTLLAASDLSGSARQNMLQSKNRYAEQFESATDAMQRLATANAQLDAAGNNTDEAFAAVTADVQARAAERLEDAAKQAQLVQAIVTAIIFTVAMGTAIGVYFIYKSIVFPMAHMQSVIRRINRGKTHARVKLTSHDELADLGRAFNNLLDERIQHLEEQSHENERLNNSIISLIKALGTIAKKDLTVKVPVSPDITGTISDAVNMLTTETARTLHQVKDISEQVNQISGKLHNQSSLVVRLADDERRQVIATSKALEVAARAMNDIARRADNADGLAKEAIEHTKSARGTVVETVNGIRAIRETISETEKRMKRLGDRSQEISGIVNLINTISERTHILALNASMHAASAGEAGKGFAVVADEVQRLAENAREATAEISSMVNNIRVETSDTVNIMNTLIAQVADGSRLAEQAGQRMDATEQTTSQLVETVKSIAESSSQQADIANKVRDRANLIRSFTEKTGQQLEEQKRFADSLKRHAATLVGRVNVFTLPEAPHKAIDVSPVEGLPCTPHEATAQTVA